ncbi:lysophospholipid acyltransferase family protein [Agromyces seonyuensis]|uniref:1-acyl-sn-glycerol-3-phosphate acyltransferase n=1 Tax=Agromyces seonyuensis TaxID=2662446 RepID=A0A6I4NZW7_9MICO|nr:lysophospholipid acyltransferase family protein [Agromyces seonyuensis]MWB98762.1 1-acyl-sn-glycerol-3-phosphate acyltransferase [Agromyces seonyuensis]
MTVDDSRPDAAPRAARRGPVYWIASGILGPLARAIYRPVITGAEHVPKDGPLILASNHLSFIDSVVIPLTSPRPVQFIAKSHYFTGTGFKGWVSRTFFEAIGAVSVERGAGAAAQEALDQSKRILVAGNALALYPEGTRSLDGRLYKGRTGIAWLALETGAKVVPVGLVGTQHIQPVGAKLPRVKPVEVHFGEPIDVSGFGPSSSGRARRQATDEIMAAIHALSGQELAGRYNEAPPSGTVAKAVDRVLPRERTGVAEPE